MGPRKGSIICLRYRRTRRVYAEPTLDNNRNMMLDLVLQVTKVIRTLFSAAISVSPGLAKQSSLSNTTARMFTFLNLASLSKTLLMGIGNSLKVLTTACGRHCDGLKMSDRAPSVPERLKLRRSTMVRSACFYISCWFSSLERCKCRMASIICCYWWK